jgi:transposase InsO family protein
MHRLVLRLQPYDVALHYGPGSQNHAADLLSRADIYMDIKNEPIHMNTTTTRKRSAKRRVLKHDYEVEHILSRRPIDGRENEYEYLVKWKGYSDDDNTWEPISHLHASSQAVADFHQQLYEDTQSTNTSSKSELNKDKINDEDSSTTNTICDICNVKCSTVTELYIHRFKQHDVPIPTPQYEAEEINTELLYSLQQHEPQFRVIYDSHLGEDELDYVTNHEKKMLSSYEFVLDANNILYCVELPGVRTKSKVRTQLRLCLPKQLRHKIMKEIHDGVLSSHPGVIHMYDKLREYVWWPHMLKDVVNYVKHCDVCQRTKSRKQSIPSQPVHIPLAPWTHISVDHIGRLPKTDRGYEYVLVIEDQYTRFSEAFAVSDVTAKTTARTIIDGIICRYGLPMYMTSDRGSGFVSQLATNIYKELGIKQKITTSYHPQANGIVESFNGTLKKSLKLWCNERQSDWDLLLPYALFAYNTSYHSLLQETPYYLNHGRDARTIVDMMIGKRPEYKAGVHEYATELAQNLYDVHMRVKDILKNVNDDRIENASVNELPSFNIDDKVLMYDPTTPKGQSRKLVRRWRGPYIIVNKISNTTYQILKDGISQTVHVERLRKQNAFDDDHLQDELMSAEDEIRAIEEVQQQLLARKKNVEDNKNKLSAAVTVNQNDENDGAVMIMNIDIHW